jgi:DNA-binding HxlR family transcriptional regulator
MSSKDNAAIGQLLGLLEARYAMRVLWALRDGHAQTFRLLQDSVGGITPNTLNTRIKELREAGLVNHGSDGYCVTASGSDLLKRMAELPAFATKWTASQARKNITRIP